MSEPVAASASVSASSMRLSTSMSCERTAASSSHARISSIDRRLRTVARGCEDRTTRGSTSKAGISCRASSTAAARPAGPPPTTSTGTSSMCVFGESMRAIVRLPARARMSNRYSIDQTARMGWPLVGREAGRRLVDDALSAGTTGGVVIAGPAGVGKTRLVTEFARRSEPRGCEVTWVRATGSAASIPLGAFAQALSAADLGLPEGVELLARARRRLAERAGGHRLVLCVDDGQHLDDASATLVHQLVVTCEAFAIVTVRSGDPVPDAVRALWKDELCTRLELAALSREDVDVLLAAALGAPADGATVTALWKRTRGNALFVRELVRHGLDGGLLADEGGLWRWRGRVEGGARLAELVDLRIDGLRAPIRDLLE